MIQRFDHFMSGPATARKPGAKQSPVLAGLREKARRLLAGLDSDSTFTAGTAPATEITPMIESHTATAVRIHTSACPSIKLSARGTLDPASAHVAERAWRQYHAAHTTEMAALGVTADELCSFMRLELRQ